MTPPRAQSAAAAAGDSPRACADRFLRVLRREGLAAALRGAWDTRVRPLFARRCLPPSSVFTPAAAAPGRPLAPHPEPVDVVVCVHDALDDVRACLSSVVRHTRPPYRLVLVDDGSADATREFLRGWAARQGALLVRHDAARGYTRATNAGWRAAAAPWVVLLNSDTLVTPLWLDRLVAAASAPGVGLAGPLSNAASWQSVPEVFDAQGDWHENPLPPGVSVGEQARRVARYAPGLRPAVPLLNGFCLLVRRAVLEALGGFDAEHFPRGYGEENDFVLRARRAGWTAALADDAYVFHRQSRSYSHERRRELSAAAAQTLVALHGATVFREAEEFWTGAPVAIGWRARARAMPEREDWIARGRARWEGRRVLFLLPAMKPGGGAHVILQEAHALQRMGVDARLLNWARFKLHFEESFPERTVPVLYAAGPEELRALRPQFDAVVATAHESVEALATEGAPAFRRAYYIQDYEPWFHAEGSDESRQAKDSYSRFPDLLRVTKTEWNRALVRRETGADSRVVGPSLDPELFHPRAGAAGAARPVRVAAMIRPETPRRNPALTMRVLREIAREFGARVEIVLFGCSAHDPAFLRLPRDFPHANEGVLTRTALAAVLNGADVFVDFSSHQAMGLTALEAMACGLAVVVPAEGGAAEFARDGENALVADTKSEAACRDALRRLAGDVDLRRRLATAAVDEAARHPPERAAYALMDALFPDAEAAP